jgi:glycosyltransferase involved in cell wall biosynthesis
MRIALITHPQFMKSQSMPRFAGMLCDAYEQRGHQVSMHTARAVATRWITHPKLSKWAGYIDQFLLFPIAFRREMAAMPADTLFVFCDQALGPWVPLVAHRPHVVHAHDLLALRSALGLIPENPTGFTGRIYQRYIRSGFRRARHFVAISGRTRADLIEHAGVPAEFISVVHNDLNQRLAPTPVAEAQALLKAAGLPDEPRGFLLHVGGSQWYKNAHGIVALYAEHARRCEAAGQPVPPLLMVSPPPDNALLEQQLAEVPAAGKVLFRQGLSTPTLQAAYSLCAAFLFPSLAEGFGWPIVESQACGTLVLTTDDAPMNEVAGPAAFLVPRLMSAAQTQAWAQQAANVLRRMTELDAETRAQRVQQGLDWSARFACDAAIEGYLRVYAQALQAGQGD